MRQFALIVLERINYALLLKDAMHYILLRFKNIYFYILFIGRTVLEIVQLFNSTKQYAA